MYNNVIKTSKFTANFMQTKSLPRKQMQMKGAQNWKTHPSRVKWNQFSSIFIYLPILAGCRNHIETLSHPMSLASMLHANNNDHMIFAGRKRFIIYTRRKTQARKTHFCESWGLLELLA